METLQRLLGRPGLLRDRIAAYIPHVRGYSTMTLALTVAISLVLAAICAALIEQPLIAAGRRRVARRQSAAQP